MVRKFGNTCSSNAPTSPSVRLEEYETDWPEDEWSFCEVVGGGVLLSNQSRPDDTHATRGVGRCCRALTLVYWRAALPILPQYVWCTGGFGMTFLRGKCLS